jgi:hypothetical protein
MVMKESMLYGNSSMGEITRAKWIHVLAGEVYHDHK